MPCERASAVIRPAARNASAWMFRVRDDVHVRLSPILTTGGKLGDVVKKIHQLALRSTS
jgi:hypothetical protein